MFKFITIFSVVTFVTISFSNDSCPKTMSCPSEDKKKCAEYKKEAIKSSCCEGKVKSTEVGKEQKKCPVMGGAVEVGKSEYTEVKGKRIYICCKGCEGKINADPDKFIKQLEAEGVELEKVPN